MSYYHVRITPKFSPSKIEVELDISLEKLTERFVDPYTRGTPIVIAGRAMLSEDIERIQINRTEQGSTYLNSTMLEQQRARRSIMGVDHRGLLPADVLADNGEDVTDKFITGSPGSESDIALRPTEERRPATTAREVFVVSGRNLMAQDALFEFLRSIDLHPLEWSEAVSATGKTSPYIGEILDAAFSRAHAVVVLFTPDDEARLREPFRTDNEPSHEAQLTGQARPNVLFEAGMAMGRNQDRAILVELGTLRPFTDVAGIHVIRLDNTSQRRQELAQRLQATGCPVRLDGTDWHAAGDFQAALDKLVQGPSASTDVEEQRFSTSEYLQLSEDAKELLVEATNDEHRMIVRTRKMGGVSIHTNHKSFGEMGNRRLEARWEQAIRELHHQELIEDPKGQGNTFEVTHKGFSIADGLGISMQGRPIHKRTTAEHPVDRVYGILGKDALGEGVSVDDYIEDIRGR